MLLIPCPFCGPRSEDEFVYGADATAPHGPAEGTDDAWLAWLYLRDNPKGPHDEFWWHRDGCGRWMTVRRNTHDHSVAGAWFSARGQGAR
jgi:heterotetrameric sarcosine oxidase delta subunit